MGLDNPLHIAFLVVILLLVFGARRLPEIGRSLGGGMREFKDSISGESKQPTITQAVPQQPVVQPQAAPVQQPVAQPQPTQPQATQQQATQQQAAEAFGTGAPPEQEPVQAAPTQQA